MNAFDTAVNLAANNESGAAVCRLADGVDLLVSDHGETFTIWNYRASAKRTEKPVSVAWAYRFLSRAFGVTVSGYEF